MADCQFTYPVINMKKTGRFLRIVSKKKGFSVKFIQTALGLASNQAVYDWFNGKTLPTVDNLLALSCLLGIPMNVLLVTEQSESQLMEILEQAALENKNIYRLWTYQKQWGRCA